MDTFYHLNSSKLRQQSVTFSVLLSATDVLSSAILLKRSGFWVSLHTSRDKCLRLCQRQISEAELDMSETWSETRKYSLGLVRSGRSSGIWPLFVSLSVCLSIYLCMCMYYITVYVCVCVCVSDDSAELVGGL